MRMLVGFFMGDTLFREVALQSEYLSLLEIPLVVASD